MITSTSNQQIKQIVQWNQKAKSRREDGVFVAEGVKMFLEAPTGWLEKVYISKSFQDKESEKIVGKLKYCDVEVVADEVFLKISNTQTPQGVLCILRQPQYTIEQLGLSRQEQPLLMVLEDIQDPGNLGTIVRTSEGAGVTGVIMTKDTADIFNPKTIRATMGSVYRVPFVYVDSLSKTIHLLKQNSIRIYAAHLDGKRTYTQVNCTQGTAFLIGNEGNGLQEDTARMADEFIHIPMEGRVESLNAAIASSLLMYEAYRQRHS